MNKIFILFLGFILTTNAQNLETFYGNYKIEDSVIHELIADKDFQRLKDVRQYGPRHHLIKEESYTRYDHSVGVMILLRRFGLSLDEQIAGLLHDVSHTVFSHVGDLLFHRNNLNIAYQDEIHYEFVKNSSLKNILNKYNITVEKVALEKEDFHALEQDLPDLCADRLEYNLQGGYVHGILTKQDISDILGSLRYENQTWYFTSKEMAIKFAEVPLILMKEVWSSHENAIVYDMLSNILMIALEKNIIAKQDISNGTDDIVWHKLLDSEDNEIKQLMNKLLNWKKNTELTDKSSSKAKYYKSKFRGVNPLVQIETGLVRLTELDSEFTAKYEDTRKYMTAGYYVNFLD